MKRIARPLLAAAALALCAPAAAQPSEEAFTQAMAERVRAALPGREVRIAGPLQLHVAMAGQDPAEINVGRIFSQCRSLTAAECEEEAAHFAAAIGAALTEQGAITRAQLRVVMRHPDFCAELGRIAEAGEGRELPILRAQAPDLCALVMADYPTSMRGVAPSELEALGLSLDEAWQLAERQTLAALPNPPTLEGLADGIVAISGFDYIPTLLLNAAGWRALAAQGDILVAVPAEDLMMVARAATITDMAAFKRATREGFETAGRGISPHVYRWTAQGWARVD